MYLCEKGDWDHATRTYNRYTGREWNKATLKWDDVKSESPFLSIPHAFWWAVTTATTVGYGDMFPTTSGGYAIAALTMMYSLIILALPVGVISGNFTTVWEQYEKNSHKRMKDHRADVKFITSAIQRIDPFAMSQLLLVEVWNERSPHEDPTQLPPREGVEYRPDIAEFMGEAAVHLDLSFSDVVQHTITCPLVPNTEVCDREVAGTITLSYEWTPWLDEVSEAGKSPIPLRSRTNTCDDFPTLQGTLRLVILHADGLADFSWSSQRKGTSNPYCMVYCYPRSPEVNSRPIPDCWRSPSQFQKLNPTWNAGHCYEYRWRKPEPDAETSPDKSPSKVLRDSATMDSGDSQKENPPMIDLSSPTKPPEKKPSWESWAQVDATKAGDDPDLLKQLVANLGEEVQLVRREVNRLRKRAKRAGSAGKERKEDYLSPHLQALQLNKSEGTDQRRNPPLPHTMEHDASVAFNEQQFRNQSKRTRKNQSKGKSADDESSDESFV